MAEETCAIDCATVAVAIAIDIRGERVTVTTMCGYASEMNHQSSGYAAEDYTCAICLEILLRPIALSCGHRFCRGCWCRVLQGSEVRAIASRTGNVACPLGRCVVRPTVPEVDHALGRDLAWRFASQLSARTAPTEAEEMESVTEVNAWAASGCKPAEVRTAAAATPVAHVVVPRRPPSRCRVIVGRILAPLGWILAPSRARRTRQSPGKTCRSRTASPPYSFRRLP